MRFRFKHPRLLPFNPFQFEADCPPCAALPSQAVRCLRRSSSQYRQAMRYILARCCFRYIDNNTSTALKSTNKRGCFINRSTSRGTGPRAAVTGRVLSQKTSPFRVGRGPVPRHAAVYRKFAGDRPPRCGNGRGSSSKNAPFRVGRGPVPRHAAIYRKFAGDRPPRYGNGRGSSSKNVPLPRRARACPSPCCGLPEVRGGQAPALR